ncbi:MAG: hypothetical protein DYH12_30015, partial [Sorangiineae bacterium PRO1]|nr:hypothetical protein [Sorangiineae bacterium PRO1]
GGGGGGGPSACLGYSSALVAHTFSQNSCTTGLPGSGGPGGSGGNPGSDGSAGPKVQVPTN